MTLNILLYVSIGLFALVVIGIIIDRSLAYKRKKRQVSATPTQEENLEKIDDGQEEKTVTELERSENEEEK